MNFVENKIKEIALYESWIKVCNNYGMPVPQHWNDGLVKCLKELMDYAPSQQTPVKE